MNLELSKKLWAEAEEVILGGGQGHKRPGHAGYPLFMQRGKGCRVWDVDGNEYIDYLMAFGPILLGYAYEAVDNAAKAQIDEAMIFNQHHPIEIKLARKLIDIIPCAEMVTFCLTGSDATSSAVKLARGYTGRPKVIRCGYHGWHDWCHAGKGALPATTQYTLEMPYNDLDALEELLKANRGEVACIIMEPLVTNPPKPGYLEGVRKLATEYETLLIFDEVKTGFRISLGGAQKYLGITPDMATFGKAMGNGYPIGCVVGKREIMEKVKDVWIAATFNGHFVSAAAALATIEEMEKHNGIQTIWRQGEKLQKGLDEIMKAHGVDARPVGLGPMPHLAFGPGNEELRDQFYTEAAANGVYFSPGHVWFISLSHDDEAIQQTLDASEKAIKKALR